MDSVTGGMETSRQTYDDKLTAVESDLKKLGNLQWEWTIKLNPLTQLYVNDHSFLEWHGSKFTFTQKDFKLSCCVLNLSSWFNSKTLKF